MVSILDAFERGDEALDASPNWETGEGDWGPCSIVSGAVEADSVGVDANGRYVGAVLANDHRTTVAIDFDTNTWSSWGGASCRGQSGVDESAYIGYIIHEEADVVVDIFRFYETSSAFGFVQLGSDITGNTWANGDRISLDLTGTALEMFLNDVSVGSTTDTTLSSGAPGLAIFVGTPGPGSTVDVRILEFRATDGATDTSQVAMFTRRVGRRLRRM